MLMKLKAKMIRLKRLRILPCDYEVGPFSPTWDAITMLSVVKV